MSPLFSYDRQLLVQFPHVQFDASQFLASLDTLRTRHKPPRLSFQQYSITFAFLLSLVSCTASRPFSLPSRANRPNSGVSSVLPRATLMSFWLRLNLINPSPFWPAFFTKSPFANLPVFAREPFPFLTSLSASTEPGFAPALRPPLPTYLRIFEAARGSGLSLNTTP